MDLIAQKIGMDPYEFRMKNILTPGDETISGEIIYESSGSPSACLNAVVKELGWTGYQSEKGRQAHIKTGKARGKGIAALQKAPAMPSYTSTGAIMQMDEDGYIYHVQYKHRRMPYSKLSRGYVYENGNGIGGPLISHGVFMADTLTNLDSETGQGNPALAWTFGAHGLDLEVDIETGDINILKVASAFDLGKVMNCLYLRKMKDKMSLRALDK